MRSQMAKFNSGNYQKFIPIMDPLYQEIQISYRARERGITSGEMRRRDKDAEACTRQLDWANYNFHRVRICQEAASWGLSELVYQEESLGRMSAFRRRSQNTGSASKEGTPRPSNFTSARKLLAKSDTVASGPD
jgi:hypothetical protein